jgi:hypothetical protein
MLTCIENLKSCHPELLLRGTLRRMGVRMLAAGVIFPLTPEKISAVVRSLRLRFAQRRDDMVL